MVLVPVPVGRPVARLDDVPVEALDEQAEGMPAVAGDSQRAAPALEYREYGINIVIGDHYFRADNAAIRSNHV